MKTYKLPPVTQQFYERLERVFPPINHIDIKPDTDMIDIQRKAAQQEVLAFIKEAVQKEEPSHVKESFWTKFIKQTNRR